MIVNPRRTYITDDFLSELEERYALSRLEGFCSALKDDPAYNYGVIAGIAWVIRDLKNLQRKQEGKNNV